MKLPADERERLSSLQAHAIMDTAADPYLDRLTSMAARQLHVPIVLVNLLDADRQWAKAAFGLPRGYEVPRDLAFCSYTILTPGQVTVIPDTTLDARLANNPFVVGKPRFRFYAGVPITDGHGRALGALCALDTRPRDFSAAYSIILSEVAESVSARLELYHANAALRESKEHYHVAVAADPHMRWTMSAPGIGEAGEEGEERWLEMIGSPYESSDGGDRVRAVHPEDLSLALASWSAALREGQPLDVEHRLRLANGSYRWFRVRATPRRDEAGRIMRWYGMVEDIHDRKLADVAHLETATKLRLALDVGRLRTWELDLASRRLTASDVSVINFGLQLGAAASAYDTALARMHPEDEQRYGREVERAWAAGQDLEVEYRSIWPDGTVHWIRINGRPTKDEAGKPVRLVGLSLDITAERVAEEARQRAEARIAYLARHDPLTGLANRLLFHQKLAEAMQAETRVALLRIDLDDFKAVNEAVGHGIGDRLLQQVAERLKVSVAEEGLVARYESDEFAIILGNVGSPEQVDLLTRRLMLSLGEPIHLAETTMVVGGSVGISMAPDDAINPAQLLRNADTALRRAKSTRRGGCQYFEPAMDIHLQALDDLRLSLRDALSRGEFRLFYQPLVSMGSGTVTAVEALIRWRHPVRGMVSPADFIPLAEETGLIVPIGRWVLEEACREAASWPGDVRVAVNLSAVQFGHKALGAEIRSALAESGLAPERLELEVTETLLLQDDESNTKLMRTLRKMGVRLAMDDFGTGYSSLGYLRRFDFDKIKIDQSLIRDLPDGAGGDAIVQAIIALAHSLGMSVTAEGVETQAQLDLLRDNGCGQVQGYLFSRPVPASDVPALLARTFTSVHPPSAVSLAARAAPAIEHVS